LNGRSVPAPMRLALNRRSPRDGDLICTLSLIVGNLPR
jgi:hypothetical protein